MLPKDKKDITLTVKQASGLKTIYPCKMRNRTFANTPDKLFYWLPDQYYTGGTLLETINQSVSQPVNQSISLKNVLNRGKIICLQVIS